MAIIVWKLRKWYWQRIRKYRYEICKSCGCPVGLIWHAPNQLWLEVIGHEGSIRCIKCFDKELNDKDYYVEWKVEAKHV